MTKKFKKLLNKNNNINLNIYKIDKNREQRTWRTQLNYNNFNLDPYSQYEKPKTHRSLEIN
jgi:hypothetical protein